MKLLSLLQIGVTVLALATHIHAQEQPVSPWATPDPKKVPKWNVRVEVMAVSMPQEKALAWLPELLDESKIEGVVPKIVEGIQRKEVTLIGYQMALTLDDITSTTETIVEEIYPTQYEPPTGRSGAGAAPTPTPAPNPGATPVGDVMAFPTAFEKRNTGLTLEVQSAQVIDHGKRVLASIRFQDVSLPGWTAYEASKTSSGKLVRIKQPIFFAAKSTARTTTPNGHFILFGAHKLEKPAGTIALYLLRFTATPLEP